MSFNYPWRDLIPQTFTCLREGYTWHKFFHDFFAGIAVGILSLPLAMAFAVGAGLPPERGIFTTIVAGFLISFLGGSRLQIGGPTGAFVVIIADVVMRYGYEGLAIATLMAGVLLILMGLFRFGTLLRFIPYPVVTGFTSGIGVIIFSSQIRDFFGLDTPHLPIDFIGKWCVYCYNFPSFHLPAFFLASLTMVIILALRHYYPKVPGAVVAIAVATCVSFALNLDVETIGSKFGTLPSTLPQPTMPSFSFSDIQQLFPDAITIAFLAGIESLLSGLVADGRAGTRLRSNCELVGQGIANIGAILFGGIPATGAFARTAANITLGAKTPFSGMFHAAVVLGLIYYFSSLVSYIPLACMSAILVIVAWNMFEWDHWKQIFKSSLSETLVLLITFALTVLIDLTVAIQIGVVLSALLFLKNMTHATSGRLLNWIRHENQKGAPDTPFIDKPISKNVAVFEIEGPFFYAVSDLLQDVLKLQEGKPHTFILLLGKTPLVDTSGIKALHDFIETCRSQGIKLLIANIHTAIKKPLEKNGVTDAVGRDNIFQTLDEALKGRREES